MTLGQVRKHLPVRLGHRAATCILRSTTTNIRIKAWAMTSLLTYALEVNTHYFDSKLILCSNILTNPTRSCIITLTQKGRCERLTSQSISSFVLGPVFGRPASNTGEVTRFLTLELLFRVTFSISKSVRELAPQEPLPDERYPPTLGLELLHVQPFRELFADHVLPPGESLQVKRVAFLFTDLLGSTAMYARKGDPRAFGLVREHFEVLFQAAERHRGITVKTIGDAVMASFMTSLDALRAAIDVHREIEVLNQQLVERRRSIGYPPGHTRGAVHQRDTERAVGLFRRNGKHRFAREPCISRQRCGAHPAGAGKPGDTSRGGPTWSTGGL